MQNVWAGFLDGLFQLKLINQRALAVLTSVYYTMLFAVLFFAEMGITHTGEANAINVTIRGLIMFAALIWKGGLGLVIIEWILRRKEKEIAQRSISYIVQLTGYMIWILAGFAIVNFALNKAGITMVLP